MDAVVVTPNGNTAAWPGPGHIAGLVLARGGSKAANLDINFAGLGKI